MSSYVRGERCPVTGGTDVVTTPDGKFLCLTSGIKWSKPKGRGVDRDSVKAFRKRGPLSSTGQLDISAGNHNAPEDGYDDMTKAQLVELAEDRQLTVDRLDGEDGEPLRSDYIAALRADDAGE